MEMWVNGFVDHLKSHAKGTQVLLQTRAFSHRSFLEEKKTKGNGENLAKVAPFQSEACALQCLPHPDKERQVEKLK